MEWKNFSNRNNLDYSSNWLITYTDMITIILCFFIVFFVYSSEETSLLQEIKESLTNELEDLSQENKELKKEQEALEKYLLGDEKKSNNDFLKFLEENDLEDSVYIAKSNNGLVIRFRDAVLFESAKAEVSQQGLMVLNEIGEKLKEVNNSIVIEGYTDNLPILSSKYPSNWELSVDRAIGVAKYFIDNLNIEEDRISVSGYGEQKPIDTNETEEGRANNRRIEITILN